jgi:hypothetical protein
MLLQLLCDNKEVIKKAAKDLKNMVVFFKSFAAFFDLSANFPEDISLLLFLYVFYHMNCSGGMS